MLLPLIHPPPKKRSPVKKLQTKLGNKCPTPNVDNSVAGRADQAGVLGGVRTPG